MNFYCYQWKYFAKQINIYCSKTSAGKYFNVFYHSTNEDFCLFCLLIAWKSVKLARTTTKTIIITIGTLSRSITAIKRALPGTYFQAVPCFPVPCIPSLFNESRVSRGTFMQRSTKVSLIEFPWAIYRQQLMSSCLYFRNPPAWPVAERKNSKHKKTVYETAQIFLSEISSESSLCVLHTFVQY